MCGISGSPNYAFNYFRYHLKNLSSEKLNLACKDRSCHAKALVHLPKESGLILVHSTRNTGKGRVSKSYKLNFADLRLRNLDEYIVLTIDSPPHTCQSKPLTLGPEMVSEKRTIKKD